MGQRLSLGTRKLLGLGACLALAVTAAAFGARGGDASGTVVNVKERDFVISKATRQVSAGTVVLRVQNNGPDKHELIVVRVGSKSLPLRTDGMTINEEKLGQSTLGVLEPGEPGSVRELSLQLRRGRYELFCNMSGHYMGGMHTVLVVK